MFFPAMIGMGGDILIIKDNKIIGKGKIITSDGEIASIRLIDEGSQSLIPKKYIDGVGFKMLYLRCHYTTGVAFGLNFITDEEFIKSLENVRVVEEELFYHGCVPESFKDVGGYDKHTKEP